MSVQELEQAVKQLSEEELEAFAQWFADFHDSKWDEEIAEDSRNGSLDALIRKAHQDFESGRCQEL